MKLLTFVIVTFTACSLALSNGDHSLSPGKITFEPHPDIKLNQISIAETDGDELVVSGVVQYTKLRGTLHGHLDLLTRNDSNENHLLGSSGKLSTYRGLMGYKIRHFRIRIHKPSELDAPFTLRFHEHNVRPHPCEC